MQPSDDEALQTDLYLDWLIATRGGSVQPLPAVEQPDEPITGAAMLLRRALVRFHPSFRFEERLATRLATAAGEGEGDRPADRAGELVAVPFDRSAQRSAGETRNRLLLSGAIASGVSIAGAALFAWRRSRPPAGALGRAARVVHGARSSSGRSHRRTRHERLS